jgi:hypothetical protein
MPPTNAVSALLHPPVTGQTKIEQIETIIAITKSKQKIHKASEGKKYSVTFSTISNYSKYAVQ